MEQVLQMLGAWLWAVVALVAAAMALVVLSVVWQMPRVKGWRGERRVRQMLRRGLNPYQYELLHNVTLPTIDGRGTTQIDHLIFSPFGVFVLETKNLKGWIFGKEREAKWTQKLHPRHSVQFQNPLRQNYLHTQTLQHALALPAAHVHSVVAFVGTSQFKTEMPPNVVQGSALLDYVRQFQTEVWPPEAMQDALDRLEALRLPDDAATHRQHLASLRQSKGALQPAPAEAPAQMAAAPAASTAAPAPAPGVAAPVISTAAPAAPKPAPVPQPVPPAAVPRAAISPKASAHPMAPAPSAAPQIARTVLGSSTTTQHITSAGPSPLPTPALAPAAPPAPVARAPAPKPSKTLSSTLCPMCQAPLQRIRLQRGPLAGEAIYRCSQAPQCGYVQPPSGAKGSG